MDKDIKKKVDEVIDSILKESRMLRKEFEEVKGIASEMKPSSKTKLLTPTSIAMARPTKEVTVVWTSAQALAVPYATVAHQQTLRNPKKIEEVSAPRKSTRFEKTKNPPKKRVKKKIGGPSKRTRTLQVSFSKSEEEIGDRPVEPMDQEVKTSAGMKAWKPKV